MDVPSNGLFYLKFTSSFLLLVLFSRAATGGDFPLDFQIGGSSMFFPGNCGVNGEYTGMCNIGLGNLVADPDTTPFFQGSITINNVSYWHLIIGDPASGFAMENYIPIKSPFLSPSGGKPSDIFNWDTDLETFSGNGWDPLGMDPSRDFDYTGNGSADPTKVVLRQVMGGNWDDTTNTWSCDGAAFCSEFLKEELGFKPKIVQIINDESGYMISDFELDMSNLTYSDDSTAGTLKNTLIITDPDMPSSYLDAGDFDMSTDRQAGHSTITGGRYTYTPCVNIASDCWIDGSVLNYTTGADASWDFEEGSYSYVSGDADPLSYEWDVYWDPNQNPIGPGNEAKCDSAMIRGTCP